MPMANQANQESKFTLRCTEHSANAEVRGLEHLAPPALDLSALRTASVELSWMVMLATGIAEDGNVSLVCRSKLPRPSEEETCRLIDGLRLACRLYNRLYQLPNSAGSMLPAEWGTISTSRPKLDDLIRPELKKELELCKQSLLTIFEGYAWEPAEFRATIEKTTLPKRIKAALVNLPDFAIDTKLCSADSGALKQGSANASSTFQGSAAIWVNSEFEEAISELNAMVGLAVVKDNVRSYANLIAYNMKRSELGLPPLPFSMNFVFTGNPGTGKTTVARCLGKIMKAAGLLDSGHVVEVSRADLVAGYVGQSEEKTAAILNSAVGGVLFIDEAYTLTDAGDKDFGRKALDVIQKFIEDRRGELAVMVAGYPDKMEQFLNSDPGLRSRFNVQINFPDYSTQELTVILGKQLQKFKLEPTPEFIAAAHAYLCLRKLRNPDRFANARECRNLSEEIGRNHADTIVQGSQTGRISLSDLNTPSTSCLPFSKDLGLDMNENTPAKFTWRVGGENGGFRAIGRTEAGLLFLAAIRQEQSLDPNKLSQLPELVMP